MTTKDVRDLFAYLKTLPPVAGKAPAVQKLAFPFNIRRAIGLWKLSYLGAPPPAPAGKSGDVADLAAIWSRDPAIAANASTPRGWLGGVAWSDRLKGGPLPDGKGKAPALTPTALKDWSKEDIAEALSSGSHPDRRKSLGGAMAAVVRDTAELPPEYRSAIAEYLKAGRD